MGKMSRDKGARGERLAAQVLSETLGISIERKARNGKSDSDLQGLEGFSVEVKYLYRQPAVDDWWEQTIWYAATHRNHPLLIYKLPKKDWRIRLHTSFLFPGHNAQGTDSWIEVSPTTFAYLHQHIGFRIKINPPIVSTV